MRDMVVILNLDGAASRAMTRKLRSEHIFCKVLPADVTAEAVLAQEPMGILLAGGETGEAPAVPHLAALADCGLPLLAMGDAALAACTELGGILSLRSEEPQVAQVRYDEDDPLFRNVEDGERYLQAMRTLLPAEGMITVAMTDSGALGMRLADRPVYALAFQAEQNDPDGLQMLLNFCTDVCGCTLWWSNEAFMDRAPEEISRITGEGEAICALSGGVDSGVSALLGHRALGQRLHCIFVDTGLLRKDEGDQVMAFYRDQMGLNVRRIDAREQFLTALAGVRSVRQKEQIIFDLLTNIMAQEVAALPDVRVILQGTNYSDTLTGDNPEAMPLMGVTVVEPVRELFKDEIRRVAEELGMPSVVIQRQPFPGSGLALRVLSDVTEEKLHVLREADAILRAEIEASGQNKRLWQYFATLATYPLSADACVITLRAVQTAEGGSATASRLPYDLLERVCEQIRRQLPQVSRVLYDLTPSDNYAHIEWR
ncbi:MAG: hypothetical protein IKK21_07560 [Clostridia bacterium]|nr:hypothetical protein [Clostridia bacterium]